MWVHISMIHNHQYIDNRIAIITHTYLLNNKQLLTNTTITIFVHTNEQEILYLQQYKSPFSFTQMNKIISIKQVSTKEQRLDLIHIVNKTISIEHVSTTKQLIIFLQNLYQRFNSVIYTKVNVMVIQPYFFSSLFLFNFFLIRVDRLALSSREC